MDFSLRTFNVYIRSIARALQARHLDHDGERDEGLLIEEILNSRPYANPRVPRDLERIERSLRRAWATERLLRRTYAKNADPVMKRDALHWLPSQAYYAIHAALDAALEAHGLATDSHQGALNSFGAAVAQQLPAFPMAVACEGHDGAWKFVGFPVTPVPQPATRVADDERVGAVILRKA